MLLRYVLTLFFLPAVQAAWAQPPVEVVTVFNKFLDILHVELG